MKNKRNFFTRSLSFNIIGAVILFILISCFVVSIVGYYSFKNSITITYATNSYRVANLSNKCFNHDNISSYIETNGESEEYNNAYSEIKKIANNMQANVIYLIQPEKDNDYNTYISVINCISDTSTLSSEWEIGTIHNTSSSKYKEIYKDMYESNLKEAYILRTNNLNGASPHITTLSAVYDSYGKCVGIMCVQYEMTEYLTNIRIYATICFLTAVIFAVVVALLASLYIKYQFVKPLKRIIDETERFSNENKQSEEKISLKSKSKIQEINTLATSIDTLEEKTTEYVKYITNVSKEKERIGVELGIANTIQEASIPKEFPLRDDLEMYAYMKPAKEVGGDFYNFFFVDDNHLALVMADVSGKGIPAALFMMVSTILITDTTNLKTNPSEILEFANKRLCDHNPADMFVTVWLGILDVRNGIMKCANAGHDEPFIYRNGLAFTQEKNTHGVALGAFELAKYKDYEIKLNPGDKIFLYTDGVPEATNANNEMITLDGLNKILNETKYDNPKDIIENVLDKIDKFVLDADQFDDITMLCLSYKKNLVQNKKTFSVEAKKENLDIVQKNILDFISSYELNNKLLMQLELSIEEVFINIASYAYPEYCGECIIEIEILNDNLIIRFKDNGIKYNPLEKEDPDIKESVENRNIGGLGIYLVKKNMDYVSYIYKDSYNVLTLEKKLK